VFGIVPLNRVCVTPRAILGFHEAYYEQGLYLRHQGHQRGGHVGPDVLLPQPVKDWIRRNGGLTTEMKKMKNGVDLWRSSIPARKSSSPSYS